MFSSLNFIHTLISDSFNIENPKILEFTQNVFFVFCALDKKNLVYIRCHPFNFENYLDYPHSTITVMYTKISLF